MSELADAPAPTGHATEAALADLRRRLGSAVDIHLDPDTRRKATRDYSWLSPLLRRNLPTTVPEAVVSVRTADAVGEVLAVANAHDVPVTPRGKGTTNYGQVVPLHHGIVLDLTRVDRILDVTDGAVTAECGALIANLERAAAETGQELALHPTVLQSTLGGFIAGGSGGPGALEHGLNHDGFVRRVTLVSALATSDEIAHEDADGWLPVHSYGTAGLITDATVALVPARERTSFFASFGDLEAAAAAGQQLMTLTPPPKLMAVTEPKLAALFPEDPGLEPGTVSLRALIDVDAVGEASGHVTDAGGRITSVRRDANRLLVTLINNHTTLRAKQAAPDSLHLILRATDLLGRIEAIHAAFPGGSVQLEGARVNGQRMWTGRLIAPDRGDAAAERGMAELRDAGLQVYSPHTWQLDQRLPERVAHAETHDPNVVLNPGKLPGRTRS